jgi:hypothetical protein
MDQTTQPAPSPQPRFVVRDVYDDPLSNAKRATGAFSLDRIEPGDIPWLWPRRIPLGSVTLLVGDPGVGKSLLALDIAARISTGAPWPDEAVESAEQRVEGQSSDSGPRPSTISPRPSGSDLLINAEDLIHNAIRPRLDALDADCSRIIAWAYVRDEVNIVGEPHLFGLTRDLNSLDMLLKAMPDCQLVILDPITALLGDASEQTSGDVWKLLADLAESARRYKLAVLVISHFRKKEGAAIHRAAGSLAFVAAARAVWTVVKDASDPTRRLFLPLKNNFAPDTKGLAFTIETHEQTHAATIRWHPDPIEANGGTAFASTRPRGRPDDDLQRAIGWLGKFLADSPLPTRVVWKAADANGITIGTLRRAFHKLGAIAYQPKGVTNGPWIWKLPGPDAQKPGEDFCASDQLAEKPR